VFVEIRYLFLFAFGGPSVLFSWCVCVLACEDYTSLYSPLITRYLFSTKGSNNMNKYVHSALQSM